MNIDESQIVLSMMLTLNRIAKELPKDHECQKHVEGLIVEASSLITTDQQKASHMRLIVGKLAG